MLWQLHISRYSKIRKMSKCECGCGGEASSGRRFIRGHNLRINNPMKNPEVAKKARESKTGKTYEEMYGVEEAKRKKKNMSVWMKKNNPFRGCKHTEKTCKKMSNNGKDEWKNKTYEEIFGEEKAIIIKEKQSNSMKGNENNLGKHLSEETKRKISKGHRGKPMSESHFRNWLKSLLKRPTKVEEELGILLKELFPGEYKYVGNGEVIIGRKCPDFINVNGKKKIIEMYGNFFHKDEWKTRGAERIKFFQQYGYDTLIVWSSELAKREILIKRLLVFHNSIQSFSSKQLTFD